jgi:hypothetical protein
MGGPFMTSKVEKASNPGRKLMRVIMMLSCFFRIFKDAKSEPLKISMKNLRIL